MAKLWAGRTDGETDVLVNELNASISFDARLYRQDIQGSRAHAEMLAAKGIISQDDRDSILTGLSEILDDIEAGAVEFSADAEDIHMNIESMLTNRVGEPGKRLHTARSRNDQVAVDMRLYVKSEIDKLLHLALTLQKALTEKAEENLNTVMPGYTHMQRAQPVTMGHYLMAYAEMLSRDVTRLEDCRERMDFCPLGAGALATTTYTIDREMTAKALGFKGPCPNSLDAVSDRDYCIELLAALSIMMMHLSRLSEEIIAWCSWEFGFAELDDKFATGSSIMPQKKNPDVAELARGKTGRVYGALISLLTVMKALPLAYNKDMQEDKEPVFDACDTVKLCLKVYAPMIASITFKPDNMRAAAAKGFLNATDCADYLVKKGLAFREAYGIVGKLVRLCILKGATLETLSLDEFKAACGLFETDVYEALKLENCVSARKVTGGPAPEAVAEHIEKLRAFYNERI